MEAGAGSTVEMNSIPWSPVLRYATPLPMNRILFRTWPAEHKAVSSVLEYARPRFHRLFRPSPPDEHDDDVVSPFRPSHVHEPWPYICGSRRSRPCLYVRTWPYFVSCTLLLYVRVHATCAPQLRHVRALHRPVCTYTFATGMTTLRTLRPGGSRLSGTSLRAKM